MNQVLKDHVYGLGTKDQINYMASLGGLSEEETLFLQLAHAGMTDLYIQQELGLSRKSCDRVESAVRAKLTIAIFRCINRCMDADAAQK